MFKRVRNTVAASSGGKQTSWEHTSLSGEFYFNLSLGKLIIEYDGMALADSLFTLDDTKKSHQIIAGLKAHDWYQQNPALERLDAASASRMTKNSLFVIGRNIYQAACGGANAALTFLNGFVNEARGYDAPKRKAILDGMLFEVFFDSHGELRDRIKSSRFNELFDLQRHVQFKDSFEFIAEALTAARANFYALPGKSHEVAVSVSAKKTKDGYLVDTIYVGGTNVLRPEEDAWDSEDGKKYYLRIGAERLKEKLTQELMVPARLLKLTFTPAEAGADQELRMPMGWTVRKV